jgi:hypothetical protein
VSPSAPDGVYQLDIGLYVEAAGQAHHLPLVSEGTVLEDNSVTIGPIKIGGPPPGVTVPNPTPQHPRAEGLGDVITLLGYDLIQKSDVLTLTLYWRCDAPPSTDYTTFVHVRDTRGSIVAQMDRPPADGAYPTSLWDPGEVIRDSIQVPLLPKIPPGTYQVAVGLYDFQSGARLPVADSEDNSIILAEITR